MRTHLVRALGATLLACLLLLTADAVPQAAADPCGCGPAYGGHGGYGPGCGGWRNGRFGRSGGRSLGHRPNTWDRCHEGRFIARGQVWSLLRRYVHRIRIQNHHVHPTFYFQHRWPRRVVDGASPWGGLCCSGHDVPITECPLVAAALDGDEALLEGIRELTPADRLDRGTERFFRSAYEEAAEDFAFALKHDPKDARARYGLLLCRVMLSDFRGAVGTMRTLRKLGALSGQDRLEIDSCFHDPAAFDAFREGLASLTQWKFHDVNAQIVAGWSAAVTGETGKARTHLKAALRFAPNHSVATHLLTTLDGDATDEEPQDEPAAPTPEPVDTRAAPLPPVEPAPNVAARETRPG